MIIPLAVTKSIQLTGDWESPQSPQNIQSHGLKPSMAHAPIDIVAFAPACLLGMASPKAALEPKAAATVALI